MDIINMPLKFLYSKLKLINPYLFPIEECTIKAGTAIYESDQYYICFIADTRFENEIIVKNMRPYIWVGNETDELEFKDMVGYGWIEDNGQYIDNFYLPIHDDYETVIGFMRL